MPVTEIEPMLRAVALASRLCHEVQTHYLSRFTKNGHDVVTLADYGVQAILGKTIQEYFPDDGVIAEETAEHFTQALAPEQKERLATLVGEILGEAVSVEHIAGWLNHGKGRAAACTWVIDPVDGTRGFIAYKPYIIGVGMVESGKVMGGILGAPSYSGGKLFYAWDGNAYERDMESGEDRTLLVSGSAAEIRPVVNDIGLSIVEKQAIARQTAARAFDDPATDRIYALLEAYLMVAQGRADLFLCRPLNRCSVKAWDHAAGVALVEAAGGKVTDLDGAALDFSTGETLTRNRGVVITNGHIHEVVLNGLSENAVQHFV